MGVFKQETATHGVERAENYAMPTFKLVLVRRDDGALWGAEKVHRRELA